VFFSRKQKALEALITQYLERVNDCLDRVEACLASALARDSYDTVVAKAQATHRAESQADDTRQEAAILLYGKALFPESRGDILQLLEGTDKIANAADSVARRIRYERIQVPAQLGNDFRELLSRSCDCSRELLKAVNMLFDDYNSAVHLADRVNELESRTDELEYQILDAIFTSGLSSGEKILLRDFAAKISDIADRAENAADHVRIVAIKRKV